MQFDAACQMLHMSNQSQRACRLLKAIMNDTGTKRPGIVGFQIFGNHDAGAMPYSAPAS